MPAEPLAGGPEGRRLLDGVPDESGKPGFARGTPAFPFTHGTTFDALEQMLQSGTAQPRHCPVFNEPLFYLFYGRFAYRVRMDENLNALNNDGPVALVFSEQLAAKIAAKRVFPFDSGGYEKHYRSAMGDLDLVNYQLDDLDHAKRVIYYFWQGKKEYFWFDTPNGLRPAASIEDGRRHWSRYLGMLQGTGTTGDDRRGTVEISTDQSIPIDYGSLIGIVLPRKFAADEQVIELEKNGVMIERYVHTGNRAEEEFGLIRERVCKILIKSGYLEKGAAGDV